MIESAYILWMLFGVTLPTLAIERHRDIACFCTGVIGACAVATTFLAVGLP